MNLNTVVEVRCPASADEITQWRDGYAWLAGGTWLFSEPQWTTNTLIDLDQLRWPALKASPAGLEIAATCRIAELYQFAAPPEWIAAPLLRECCDSLLASFKIWNAATVGGNICMSLPAGSMISLTVALEAIYTLWPRDTPPREVPAVDFVTGNHTNVLRPGELLRSIKIRSGKTLCFPPLVADPSGTLGRAGDRHAGPRLRRSPDHHHGGDAAAGAIGLRANAIRYRYAARDRRKDSGRRLFRRRARVAGLQAPPHLLFC
jgi:hypothetical protein